MDESAPQVTAVSPRSDRRWRQSLDLVFLLVQRDLRVRYRGSVLGYLWSMVNPLLTMAILAFVFMHLLRFKVENFPMFLLSGILTWNLFSQSLSIGVNSIIANGSLLRKVKVPAAIFPVASVTSVLVNFLLALVPYLILALATGLKLTFWFLALPLVLLPLLVFTYGASLFAAAINVRYRDFGHILDPLLTVAFYATPIVYPIDVLPENYSRLIALNPMAHFVTCVRAVMFHGEAPSITSLGIAYLLAMVALGIGTLTYRKLRDEFIYSL